MMYPSISLKNDVPLQMEYINYNFWLLGHNKTIWLIIIDYLTFNEYRCIYNQQRFKKLGLLVGSSYQLRLAKPNKRKTITNG